MNKNQQYINGQWVDSHGQDTRPVINPTTEEVIGHIALGNQQDVDDAVQAAKEAFPEWSALEPSKRASYVEKIAKGISKRKEDILDAIVRELGTTRKFAAYMQVERSVEEMEASIDALKDINFSERIDNTLLIKEGTGVVAAINPWNFPLNQIQRKVSSALLAGNTVVVKPPSETPTASYILTDIIHEVGLPKGVYNLVTGSGSDLGDYLAGHPDVSLISFTGSTEVGQGLYEKAKTTVKHLVLELGGKSALILLPDGDVTQAVKQSVNTIINNAGQTCTALTRLLVPNNQIDAAKAAIHAHLKDIVVGDPNDPSTDLGPLVSKDQLSTVKEYVEKGIEEGATLLEGGKQIDRPGYYFEPTVFVDVDNQMTIAQEEIFGPVLCVITYDSIEEAIEIANDTKYGLSGAIVGPEEAAVNVAKQLRTGNIIINGASQDLKAPFGGYKYSGIGHEKGQYGIEDYLETKAIHL